MNLALVDIVACPVIGIQLEARIAAAFVGAPIIYTAMLTQARILLALVHVHAFSIVAGFVLEASFAVATVRADAIDALSVRWAWSAILVKLTLVDVLAVSIICGYKPGWADTSVSSGLVLARLLRSANRFLACTFINIDALTAISIQLEASLARHRV